MTEHRHVDNSAIAKRPSSPPTVNSTVQCGVMIFSPNRRDNPRAMGVDKQLPSGGDGQFKISRGDSQSKNFARDDQGVTVSTTASAEHTPAPLGLACVNRNRNKENKKQPLRSSSSN